MALHSMTAIIARQRYRNAFNACSFRMRNGSCFGASLLHRRRLALSQCGQPGIIASFHVGAVRAVDFAVLTLWQEDQFLWRFDLVGRRDDSFGGQVSSIRPAPMSTGHLIREAKLTTS